MYVCVYINNISNMLYIEVTWAELEGECIEKSCYVYTDRKWIVSCMYNINKCKNEQCKY